MVGEGVDDRVEGALSYLKRAQIERALDNVPQYPVSVPGSLCPLLHLAIPINKGGCAFKGDLKHRDVQGNEGVRAQWYEHARGMKHEAANSASQSQKGARLPECRTHHVKASVLCADVD